MIRRRRRKQDSAKADLTPMIDVTFQLLIFFILCTRFAVIERSFQADLPLEEGPNTVESIPKEQVTVYCNWDAQSGVNDYVLAIGARGRKAVPGTRSTLQELVIFPSDPVAIVADKRQRYVALHGALHNGLAAYVRDSGAKIEKIEISFAVDATQGVRSGTAPWMFVSTALDAAAQYNKQRGKEGQKPLPVTFKFADALGRFGR